MQKTIIQYTRTIGASAVFGGLSLALAAFTAPYLPRMPGWDFGIAVLRSLYTNRSCDEISCYDPNHIGF